MKAPKTLLLLMFVTSVASSLQASILKERVVNINNSSVETVQSDLLPTMASEVYPKFVGGDAALFRFIEENLVYPETDTKNDIEGRVTVRFVVTENGQIRNARIVRDRLRKM